MLQSSIVDILYWIRDFFVSMWQDDDFWWYLAGMIVVLIALWKIIILPLVKFFSSISEGIVSASSSIGHTRRSSYSKREQQRIVTIKGVYQLNGPKPFVRELTCTQSEVGYYSQLMTNKSRQAQWIQANFPGANIGRGFSISVNIK